jgi:hypothetical protein
MEPHNGKPRSAKARSCLPVVTAAKAKRLAKQPVQPVGLIIPEAWK